MVLKKPVKSERLGLYKKKIKICKKVKLNKSKDGMKALKMEVGVTSIL